MSDTWVLFPLFNLDGRAILFTEICLSTHGCDSVPDQVSDAIESVATGESYNCRAKEVRDMDAGPSHSRRFGFTCLLLGLFFSSSIKVVGHLYH
jgi:hypothetical protein